MAKSMYREERFVLQLFALLLLLASVGSGCNKPKAPESPVVCRDGQDSSDGCVAAIVKHDSCEGQINIKRAQSGCTFYTEKQVHGCVVAGFAPYHNPLNDKCLVEAGYGRHCEMKDFDQATKTCNDTIELEKAGVRVYLEQRESGFFPQVIFKKSDNVKAGAEFEFLAHEYAEEDIQTHPHLNSDGRRIITVELVIPWRVTYTNGSGKELCAEGQITKDTSKEYPSEGMFCAGS